MRWELVAKKTSQALTKCMKRKCSQITLLCVLYLGLYHATDRDSYESVSDPNLFPQKGDDDAPRKNGPQGDRHEIKLLLHGQAINILSSLEDGACSLQKGLVVARLRYFARLR